MLLRLCIYTFTNHCVPIQSFSSPYFSTFGLNTEIYKVDLYIQSEQRKIGTRKTQNTNTFYAATIYKFNWTAHLRYAANEVSLGCCIKAVQITADILCSLRSFFKEAIPKFREIFWKNICGRFQV